MARAFKWVIGIVGGLLILSFIAVFIILSSYDFNNLKPSISKAVYDATGRELIIENDIELDIGLSPSLVLSGIKFQNADWGTRKEMVKVDRFEVKVSLLPLIKGNIEVNRFILIGPDILIETDKVGKTNLEFKVAEKASETVAVKTEKPDEIDQKAVKLPALTINQLEIINGTLTYRDGKTGKTEIVKLNNLKADIQGFDKPFNFDLKGAYNDNPFNVSGSLGSFEGINDPDINWPLEIVVSAFGVVAKINGSIKNPMEQQGINLNFDIKIDNWNKLSKIAGQEIPIKDPLSVSGNIIDTAPKAYKIKGLKIRLGKNQIDGSVGLNLSGKVPSVDVIMSSKELDLRPFLPKDETTKETKSKPEEATKKSEKLFSDDPFPLDSLRMVEAQLNIKFDKVILPQMVISNIIVNSSLKNGNLAVTPFKANIGGGDISLNMNLASKNNVADLSTFLNVQGLEIGDMLKEGDVKETVEGIIDVDVNLKGRGKSVASLMAGLNGHLTFIMGEGKISNKYIDMLGGGLKEGVFRLLNPSKDKKEYTAIKCTVARFDMLDGIADTTALVFDTSMMSVAGEGDIDLRTEKLNLSLNPATKGGVAEYSLNLGELAKPFKLGGTLAKPSLELDKTKAALAIGKALGESGFSSKSLKAVFLGGDSENNEDLCAAAMQAAKTGVKKVSNKKAAIKEEQTPVAPTTEKLIEDVIKDPGKAFKNFFGR